MNEETGTPTSTEEEQVEETQEEETTTDDSTDEDSEEVDVEALKSEAQKAKELAENYKKRAEKAEKKAKSTPKQDSSLSQNDIIYLAKTDIHEDDISYVTEYAQKFGLSVKEAHEQTKPILGVRNEERTTAEATSTKSPRGKKQLTGAELVRKVEESGEIPTDDRGMQEYIAARQASQRTKK